MKNIICGVLLVAALSLSTKTSAEPRIPDAIHVPVSSKRHLLKTLSFLRRQTHDLRPQGFKNVFAPFGGIDPSAIIVFDADVLITVGLESFGSLDAIEKQLTDIDSTQAIVKHFSDHGYIRSEVGGFWQAGHAAGADLLVILQKVFGAEEIRISYDERDARNVEIRFLLFGRERTMRYYQCNISDRPIQHMVRDYGANENPSQEMLARLKTEKIDAVFVKAAMEQSIGESTWTAMQNSLSPMALWVGEGLAMAAHRLYFDAIRFVQLRAGWAYQTDKAKVEIAKIDLSRSFVSHVPRAQKNWFERTKDFVLGASPKPPLNPNPTRTNTAQTDGDACQEYLLERENELKARHSKPRPPKGSGFRISM